MQADGVRPQDAPRPPDRVSSLALWAQVRADIRRRCTEGSFEAGIPGEKALSAEYGVSRHTVREALRALRDEGMIRSQRGRTSTVGTDRSPLSPDLEVVRLVESETAALLGLPVGCEVVRVRRLERVQGRVVAVQDTWRPVGGRDDEGSGR